MALTSIAHGCADFLFAGKRRLLGPERVRRTRVYGVGTGKSGTHSLAAMFSKTVRAAHEPQRDEMVKRVLDRHAGRIADEALTEWLRQRDRELSLELDSSWLNVDVLDILLREFRDARFVLTIRDCYSWCNSMMNDALRFASTTAPIWIQLRNRRYRAELFQHAPEERLLKEKDLYTLDGYFSYWAWHNQKVLDEVPRDRLLIVRTDQIVDRAVEIAEFAGLPRRAVRPQRAHAFRNPKKHELLQMIDRDFVEKKAATYCRPLMSRFFPEIKSLTEANL